MAGVAILECENAKITNCSYHTVRNIVQPLIKTIRYYMKAVVLTFHMVIR